jgi:superfamily II DNA/RNA helicase
MYKCTLLFFMILSRTSRAFIGTATKQSKKAWMAATPAFAPPTLKLASSRSFTKAQIALYSSISDNSAVSKSKAPFRSPKGAPDDSKIPQNPNGKLGELTWNPLGLWTEVVDALENDLKLRAPTPIQSLVIPPLLKNTTESMAFLAATGSGKTLAYLLPLLQHLKHQEVFENYERRPRRPRVLILAPTRELAQQISSVLKSLSHTIKVSSQAIIGGEEKGKQRKQLQREVDVVVATPGRLLQHWKDENIFLGSVDSVVLDEMDTMLEQGFQRELRELLYPLLYVNAGKGANKEGTDLEFKEGAPRIVMTSATMTQSVQKLLGDDPKRSLLTVNAKKSYVKRGDPTEEAGKGGPAPKLVLPNMTIISAPGLHKAVPRLDQTFVDVGQTDKISLLVDVISSSQSSKGVKIVFCNTATSVRAVQFALAEARIDSLSYHGELNSILRSENLKRFRDGASGKKEEPSVLVCTDLAARGLDIPQVDHVVMFDFPLNALDYLHRSGRTARGDGRGKVTALVAKRDKVLATAIELAVVRGEALDGLSSRKSDYLPGAKLGAGAARRPARGPRGSESSGQRRKVHTGSSDSTARVSRGGESGGQRRKEYTGKSDASSNYRTRK